MSNDSKMTIDVHELPALDFEAGQVGKSTGDSVVIDAMMMHFIGYIIKQVGGTS
jgi:hypothetical protein